MKTIELQLDDHTLERVRRLAVSRGCSLEELLAAIIEQVAEAEGAQDSFLGMFADEPELMDQVVRSGMQSRESHPLRLEGVPLSLEEINEIVHEVRHQQRLEQEAGDTIDIE